MALPSFAQHLGVLEDCGLERSQKLGPVRADELSPRPLEAAADWLGQQRTAWEKRLDQLDSHLNQMQEASPCGPAASSAP